MDRFGLKQFSRVAFMLTAGSVLMAQSTTGGLSGGVKDEKGAVVEGARVTITSPALFAPRVTVTDARGLWRAPLLPPGSYKITLDKSGYSASGMDQVRVGLGSSAHFDMTLKTVKAAAATVEVVASSGDIDKSDTKASTNFSAETLATLPAASRGFAGAADLAPGLTAGLGGSYSVRGGATQNTLYRVNGTDVKDDYQGNLTGTYVIEDNIEDVQVILSPLNARNGRALGGAINVVTKSGGNDFAGSIRADIGRGTWGSLNPSSLPTTNRVTDNLNKSYQVTLSGPIIKDRLWFAGGTILIPGQSYSYSTGNVYINATNVVKTGNSLMDAVLLAGPAGFSMTKFDVNTPYTQKYDDKYYEGKLTGAISLNHTLEYSYSTSKITLGPRNPFGDSGNNVPRIAALGTQSEEKAAYGINYRGVFSSNVFLEGRINKVDSRTVFPSGDPNYGTGENLIIYQGTAATGGRAALSYPFGLGISPNPDRRNNRSGNLNLKVFHDLFGGSHEMDAGYDTYEGVRGTSVASGLKGQIFRVGGAYADASGQNYLFPTINLTRNSTGSAYLYGQDSTGLRGPAASLDQQLGKDGTTKNLMQALYFNDSWTINQHWNAMLGLRFEQHKVTDTDGSQAAKATDFSPRFQVKYDINGDSKRVFTWTVARYAGDFTTGFTDAFIKKASSKGVQYGWSANAASGTAAGVQFYNYAGITDANNYKNVIAFYDSSKNYVVDSNLKTPFMDELTFGFRRGWDNGSSVKLTYVYRTWKQDWAFSTDYAADQMVTLTDPTGSGLAAQHAMVTHVFNSNDLKREYNGLELEWTGKINSVWTVGGNWTYARLVGNNNGGDSTTGQSFRDNTPEGYYYQRNYLTNTLGYSTDRFAPTGPLPQDQEQRGRLYVSAVLPLGKGTISYSAMLRYDTGTHWQGASNTPLGTVPYVTGSGIAAPTTFVDYYGGRGIYSNNDTYQVDFKINFQVPLALFGFSRMSLIGDMQINNVFNHIETGALDHTLYAGGTAGTTQLWINDPSTFGTTRNGSGLNYWNSGRNMGMSIGLKF